MKTSLKKVGFAAALFSLTPLVLVAQETHLRLGPVLKNQSLERLTLLPGPHLLSPARNTPTMMPSSMKMDSAPGFRFVTPAERFLSGGRPGTLRLIERSSTNPLSLSARPAPEPLPPKSTRPAPESLRFEATLETPPLPGLSKSGAR